MHVGSVRVLTTIACCLVLAFVSRSSAAQDSKQQETTWSTNEFPAPDDLKITADLYLVSEEKQTPLIVLCHQAGWSRGEYREIAPKLNQLGFNCLAIDQRSGGKVNDVPNETFRAALAAKKATTFTDAEQDIIAAIIGARENHATGKVILWGSSYSSALALRVAGEHPELVDGVLAFAPGEYFARMGKPNDWVTASAKKIKIPTFVTSAKKEAPRWRGIFDAIPAESKVKFIPNTDGNHGSRALWAQFDDSGEYWKNVNQFLAQFQSERRVARIEQGGIAIQLSRLYESQLGTCLTVAKPMLR